MDQFVVSWAGRTPKERLFAILQRSDESLKDCINRYSENAILVDDLNEDFKLSSITSGLRTDSGFWWSSQKTGPRDYNEFLLKAQKYINAEEAKFAAESFGKSKGSIGNEHKSDHSGRDIRKRHDRHIDSKCKDGGRHLKKIEIKFRASLSQVSMVVINPLLWGLIRSTH